MATAAPALKALSKLAQSLPLGEGEGSQGGPPVDDAANQPNISPPPPANLPPSPPPADPAVTALQQSGSAANVEGPAPLGTDQATGPTSAPVLDPRVKEIPAPVPHEAAQSTSATPLDPRVKEIPTPLDPRVKEIPAPTEAQAQPDTSQPGTFTNPATGNIQPLQTQPPAIPPKQQPTGQVSPGPTGTPDQPWGAPLDPQHQIRALLDADPSLSPGAAQAIINGQHPATISGQPTAPPKPPKVEPTPAPEQPEQKPSPQTEEQVYQSLSDSDKALYDSARGKVAGAPAGSSPKLTPAEQAVLDKIKAQTAPSGSTSDEPKTVVGGMMLKGTATSFGLNYDGSYDKDDNGIGFFGGINTRNPKLKAVAVPVDVLESAFGKFTKKNAQGGYDALDTPEAKKIIAAIRSAHVEALGLDGKIHNFPIVDIQGSLGGHPGKVLDMTPAAGRELGFNDNHSVRYQIVGGDGKPYVIPADQLAGWNSRRDEGGHRHHGGGTGGDGGDSVQPNIPLGSSAPVAQQQPWSSSGGGGGGEMPIPSSNSGGSFGAGLLGGALAAAATRGGGSQQQAQPQAPPDDTQSQQNPMIAALVARGFTPQQALNYAQGVQNIAPGKGIGPLNVKGPAPAAPSSATPIQLSLTSKQPVTPRLLSPKQLMPGKVTPIAPGPTVDPSVVLGLMKKGFTREQAIAVAGKATVTPGIGQASSFRPPPAAPGKTVPTGPAIQLGPAPAAPQKPQAPIPQKPASDMPPQRQVEAPAPKKQAPEPEPTEFTGRPAGSTHGDPNPKGPDAFAGLTLPKALKAHAAALSEDDPRVKKQADGYIKGEHFVPGDVLHEDLLQGLPHGRQGHQRQLLGQAETAIADKSPMHISYISAPAEAQKFPTRDSRKVQYDEHSPEARLMGTTEGQLVGHSLIPLNVGVKLPGKKGEPHQSYIQGLSTNVLANNFEHLNDKLSGMGRKTPYKELGVKFANDLEGYFHNLNADHVATGSGYITGTDDHPSSADRNHVPYKLTRKEADFIGAVINNDSAFAKHSDAAKIRELARANGTLITPEGETNRLRHDIEQHEPGWRKRMLEPSIRTFKSGLVHEVHPSEQHLPAEIRPGKGYQALTKALARTTERGRPDVQIGASLHHNLDDNRRINEIERDFSEHRIDEAAARKRLEELGEDPSEYKFVGGSGGLVSPYEDDGESLTSEEHNQMKGNLRQQWVAGKLGVDDYRKKVAEIPLPSKPSKPPVSSKEDEPGISPSPSVASPGPGLAMPRPRLAESESEPRRDPSKSAPSPEPLTKQKPLAPPKPPSRPQGEPAVRIKDTGNVYEAPLHSSAYFHAKNKGENMHPSNYEYGHRKEDKTFEPTKSSGSLRPGELDPGKIKPVSARVTATPAPEEKPETPPAADEPLPVAKPKKATQPAPPKPAVTPEPEVEEKLTKPAGAADKAWMKDPKNEAERQAYLEKRVAASIGRQNTHPSAIPLKVQRNEAGGVQHDPQLNPVWEKTDYNIADTPFLQKHGKGLSQLEGADKHEDTLGENEHKHLIDVERKRLSAMRNASAIHTMGDHIVNSYNKIKDIPEIAAGKGWYSRMRDKMAKVFGAGEEGKASEDHELFAQLLGATSAKTPVRDNFIQALDAFEQYKAGKFDKHIAKYKEAYQAMQDGGYEALNQKMREQGLKDEDGNLRQGKSDADAMAHWIDHHKIRPLKQNGAKYNSNSDQVLKVLSGTWLKEVGAPKTPNFAGNLTGRTLAATIDVWAARHLHRIAHEHDGEKKGWRPQSSGEPGVNSLDFAFSQDAMKHAADKIGINPDDLQAILWYAEKQHYDKHGWTGAQGAEKGSFDETWDKAFPTEGKAMTSQALQKHYQDEKARDDKIDALRTTLARKKDSGESKEKIDKYLTRYADEFLGKHGLTRQHLEAPPAAPGLEEAA